MINCVVVDVDVDVGINVVRVVPIITDGSVNGKTGGILTLIRSGNGTGFFVVNSIGSGGLSIINSGQLRHG